MPETADTYVHLFWAYAVIWLCIALFVLNLMREQRRIARDLRDVQEDLAKLGQRQNER